MKNLRNATIGLAALVATAVTGCGMSTRDDAIQAAQASGWSNVQVTSEKYFWQWTCQGGEMRYRIKGKNPAGKEAQANVCCGHTSYKGCTIRY